MQRNIDPAGPTINGVLFDKDGTLVDFDGTWIPAYRTAALALTNGNEARSAEMLEATGHDPAHATIRHGTLLAVGGISEIAAAWAPYADHPGGEALAVLLDETFTRETRRHCRMIDGAEAVLQRLAGAGVSLGVATNDSAGSAAAMFDELRLTDYFDFVCGCDSGFGRKPDAGMTEAYCRATGLAPAEIAVVGDNAHDLEMGRRAGAGLCIGVLSGNGDTHDLTDLADVIIDDVGKLEAVLGYG